LEHTNFQLLTLKFNLKTEFRGTGYSEGTTAVTMT